MKLTLTPTGNKIDCNGTTYDELNVSTGSVVFGRIIGDVVLSGSRGVDGATVPDKLVKLTGCTRQEAVFALEQYSLLAETESENAHFFDDQLTREQLLRERNAVRPLAVSLYKLIAGEAPDTQEGTFELLMMCNEILEARDAGHEAQE